MKIPNYSNYEIYPNEGKIWSYKSNKFIGAKNKKDGYWKSTLTADDGAVWKDNFHRVIWTAVNGVIPQRMQVNHIDENKDNNSISNLNLMTCKENNNWGTHNERMSKAKTNGITSKQVGAYKDGILMMIFPSTSEAHRQGYNGGNVSQCCRNCFNRQGNNIYKGYSWRYI